MHRLLKAKSAITVTKQDRSYKCFCIPVTTNRKEASIGEAEPRVQGWGHVVKAITAGISPDPEMLKAFFKKYDADKNGYLSKEELKLVLQEVAKAKRMFLERQKIEAIQKLRQQNDPMQLAMQPMVEGMFESQIALLKRQEADPAQLMDLDNVFAQIDSNSDGKVSMEEFLNQATKNIFKQEMLAASIPTPAFHTCVIETEI